MGNRGKNVGSVEVCLDRVSNVVEKKNVLYNGIDGFCAIDIKRLEDMIILRKNNEGSAISAHKLILGLVRKATWLFGVPWIELGRVF